MQAVAARDPSPRAVPFLKWAGSKRQLVPELLKRIPAKYGTYFEPFLGGGSMFFALQPTRAVLSDLNGRLIRTYCGVRDHVENVIGILRGYSRQHSEEFYYDMRSRAVDHYAAGLAPWFIYLNKSGFNGLYRVNKTGRFNVPWGKHDKYAPDEDNLRACADALKNAVLARSVFESVAAAHGGARAGDLVYMDPPYVPVSSTANFTSYTKDGFGPEDQKRVARVARELKDRGVHVIASNAGTDEVRELYRGFKIEEVGARRNINSKGDRRGPVKEFIIT